MANKNLTEFVMILDRSGSMQSIRDDTMGGFDSFIEEQRDVKGAALVSLYQFDTHYEMVYEGLEIDKVKPLVLQPRGGTALFDAIGKTLGTVRSRIDAMQEDAKPGTVIVVVMTDGGENSSEEIKSASDIKEMIDAESDWEFVYLGVSGVEDFSEGLSMGFSVGSSGIYAAVHTTDMYADLSTSVSALRTGGTNTITLAGNSNTISSTDQATSVVDMGDKTDEDAKT